jgi:hypothetical protein
MPDYLIKSNKSKLHFRRKDGTSGQVPIDIFIDALPEFNRVIKIFEDVEIPIGDILGLRNLSAFVGEVYNRSVKKIAGNLIENNPHQDGYPDLLIMDSLGREEWQKFSKQLHEKSPFSPFLTGGIEVKSTCGDLRSGSWFTKQEIPKPIIGQSRLEWVTGYNWKAHHRETNNLIGLIWDFVDARPTIVAIMYSENLDEEDWGKTVTPKKGGGRTTSVSIMTKNGVAKMYSGLIAIIDDPKYNNKLLNRLEKY